MLANCTKTVAAIGMICGCGAVDVEAQAGSWFSDPKAANIGDALTVIIQESASAQNRTSTSARERHRHLSTGTTTQEST